jgi:hypothetical protein
MSAPEIATTPYSNPAASLEYIASPPIALELPPIHSDNDGPQWQRRLTGLALAAGLALNACSLSSDGSDQPAFQGPCYDIAERPADVQKAIAQECIDSVQTIRLVYDTDLRTISGEQVNQLAKDTIATLREATGDAIAPEIIVSPASETAKQKFLDQNPDCIDSADPSRYLSTIFDSETASSQPPSANGVPRDIVIGLSFKPFCDLRTTAIFSTTLGRGQVMYRRGANSDPVAFKKTVIDASHEITHTWLGHDSTMTCEDLEASSEQDNGSALDILEYLKGCRIQEYGGATLMGGISPQSLGKGASLNPLQYDMINEPQAILDGKQPLAHAHIFQPGVKSTLPVNSDNYSGYIIVPFDRPIAYTDSGKTYTYEGMAITPALDGPKENPGERFSGAFVQLYNRHAGTTCLFFTVAAPDAGANAIDMIYDGERYTIELDSGQSTIAVTSSPV